MFNLVGFSFEIENLLKIYKKKNLHSSIIFNGPKGIGKRHFVNKFISEIIKLKFSDTNLTHHLNLFYNNSHPNIKILEKEIDKKTKKYNSNITIDQIRNLKKFNLSSSSIKDMDKFIIVDCADDLNLNSANSLLKTLEEPNNSFIFLISHQLSSLLPTIRSRCHKIKFSSHTYSDFKNILSSSIDKIKDDEIKFFYDFTQGSPGNAISLYKDDIFEHLNKTISNFNKGLNFENLELSKSISKLDDEKFKNYISLLKSLLIIVYKVKINKNIKDTFLSETLKNIQTISSFLSYENIIDRFNFLINNENDLFTYNLDKKIFMLKFLTT